ncbi:hypothetical protein EVAR_76325_1 [Eumeta japonica]|uniref:Uncharacterized protein n=1 Tax=Eumeta variegata TaxID=151549 RepID=A0A4C1TA60_EUMVA|nr:hypothetical protein EVAR_76325_1 [Eumeta japonica]
MSIAQKVFPNVPAAPGMPCMGEDLSRFPTNSTYVFLASYVHSSVPLTDAYSRIADIIFIHVSPRNGRVADVSERNKYVKYEERSFEQERSEELEIDGRACAVRPRPPPAGCR